MATQLSVEGSWPGTVTLAHGWARARARPWNDEVTDPLLRLERGNSGFLRAACTHLLELGAAAVYSPALYPGSTRVWRRGGFETFAELMVMEGELTPTGLAPLPDSVIEVDLPDWGSIVEIDRAAFGDFWGMSRAGLEESRHANRVTALLVVSEGTTPVGFAVVGAEWGVAYLHRLAVHPECARRGHGSALLQAARSWGWARGARSLALNVRPENTEARRLYERHGFVDTGSRIVVLRHPPG